jgi:peptide/nickel transport system permease protein
MMPGDPAKMVLDPSYGPVERHMIAVRYGLETDRYVTEKVKCKVRQDKVSDNVMNDLVNSSVQIKKYISSNVLAISLNLSWSNPTDLLYLGMYYDGKIIKDGKPQVGELLANGTKNETGRTYQFIYYEITQIVIIEEGDYIIVVHGRKVSGVIDAQLEIGIKEIVEVPLWKQFVVYMKSMLTGDFGRSFYTKRNVTEELGWRIPPTFLLFGTAHIIGPIIAILLGMLLAWWRGTKTELSAIVISLFFYSMPVFWFGLILLWFFAYKLELFPLGGMKSGEVDLHGFAYVADLLTHLTLPLLTLLLLSVAGMILLMRNSMMEVLGEDYIVTARAKGLSDRKIMVKHAGRTALLPVVTSIAMGVGASISGGVLTEMIFSWPGVGRLLIQSTLQQDFPVVQAAFFILALITILANVIADVLYAYLDPRVKL